MTPDRADLDLDSIARSGHYRRGAFYASALTIRRRAALFYRRLYRGVLAAALCHLVW